MKISRIQINGYKGITNAVIDVPEGGMAIFGGNSKGKTTLLRSLIPALAHYWGQALGSNYIYHEAAKLDYDVDLFNDSKVGIEFQNKDEVTFKVTGGQLSNDEFITGCADNPILAYYDSAINFAKYEIGTTSHDLDECFVKQLKERPRLNAYTNFAAPRILHRETFLNWFGRRDDKEVREMRNRNDFTYRDKTLTSIRNVTHAFMKYVFGGDYLMFSRAIERQKVFEFKALPETYSIQKNKREVLVSDLGAGERHLLFIVMGIASRLLAANEGYLNNCFHGEGVVIIDDIDLHLAVEQQSKVLPALKQVFPNIQFIVSTSAHAVAKSISDKNIYSII